KIFFGVMEVEIPGINKNIDALVSNGSPMLTYFKFIFQLFLAIIVIIGLIMVVIGGYIYMTAGGDGSRLQLAKSFISSALLGIVLALSSYLILNTISPQFASDLKEPLV